jgi:aconitate hydratase
LRGTFANIRIRNEIVPDTEGGITYCYVNGKKMSIYDAAMAYTASEIPLIVIAGKEYGTGSSRDWAAKGSMLLGVKSVLAESFERIHRSNLVGMGVLPLQFKEGESAQTHGISGNEKFSIEGISNGLKPLSNLVVKIELEDGSSKEIEVICRLDSIVEIDYYYNGGILQTVLRQMIKSN